MCIDKHGSLMFSNSYAEQDQRQGNNGVFLD